MGYIDQFGIYHRTKRAKRKRRKTRKREPRTRVFSDAKQLDEQFKQKLG